MTGSRPRTHFKTVFWFLLINVALSVALNYAYILLAPGTESFLSRLFIHGALLSNVAVVYLVLAALFSLMAAATRNTAVLSVVMVLAVTTLHILNIVDIAIFRIFKYHINSMVLTLVFTEGAGDSLNLGFKTWFMFSSIIAGVAALQAGIFLLCHTRLKLMPSTRKWVRASLALALALILIDKSFYAVSDLYDVRDVLRNAKVFPLYQGLTVRKLMHKQFGFEVDTIERLSLEDTGRTSLAYPLAELDRKPVSRYPNIIWILIDSWRFDMLTPETTPNIFRFSRDAIVFNNHYSGGNCTRFGIFSLIYGLYGTYWHTFLSEFRSPVLLDELMKLGYDFKIISSTNLKNPEFRKTAFVKLSPHIIDSLPGKSAEERDPEVARTFIRWLDERDLTKPFYAFVFFDAPHGPSTYPREFERFKPSIVSPNYLTTGKKDAKILFNSYRNAILFDDHLVGGILDEIRKRGLDRDSIILITGDHGEEYYENGFWGHTSAFSRYQAKVPLVLSVPDVPHREVNELTSHLDVVPTIMDLLGYTTPSHLYSQGMPMLSGKGQSAVLCSGWADAGIIDRVHAIVLPLNSYNMTGYEVRSIGDYRLVPDEKAVLGLKRGTVMAVMMGMGAFLR